MTAVAALGAWRKARVCQVNGVTALVQQVIAATILKTVPPWDRVAPKAVEVDLSQVSPNCGSHWALLLQMATSTCRRSLHLTLILGH